MDNNLVLQAVNTLSKRELECLQWRCKGLEYKQIAERMTIQPSSVKTYMQRVYVKFTFDDLSEVQRYKVFFELICPLLANDQVPITVTGNDEVEILIPPEVEEMVERDEQALMPIRSYSIEPIRKKTQPGRSRWSLFGAILGASVLGLILWAVNGLINKPEPEIAVLPPITEITSIEQVPVTVIVAATPEPLQPTLTPEVEQVFVVVTATNAPTVEPTEQTLPFGDSFSDNFDLGPDPAWDVVYGELNMVNGNYTVITPFQNDIRSSHLAVLDDRIWQDVRVEVAIEDLSSAFGEHIDAQFGIILRYVENGDSLGLLVYPNRNGIVFGTLHSDKTWTPFMPSFVESFNEWTFQNGGLIGIEVVGNVYSASIDNQAITSAILDGPESGKIGLWFLTSSAREGVRHFAPRVNFISVESIN